MDFDLVIPKDYLMPMAIDLDLPMVSQTENH
jgi:hypothetical protein